jgi:hypothetical protein
LVLIIAFGDPTFAQSFGFGCLGLSGIFGGYSKQKFEAEGLNKYVNQLADISADEKTFKQAEGFRIGANIFRAKFDYVFLTVKGYYQFLKEKHNLTNVSLAQTREEEFTLKLDHWGFGVDFGIPVVSFLDWKIIEAGMTIFNVKFTNAYTGDDGIFVENTFKEPKSTIGYYLSSGLIIHLIQDYVSIEGSATYNNFNIENVENENTGEQIPVSSASGKFIEKGGFSGAIYLNLGVPL